MERSITDIESIVASLPPEMRTLWGNLFEASAAKGDMEIPDTFREKVRQYFGGPDETAETVCDRVSRQRIIRIRNKRTGEETLFNSLRASRPGMRAHQAQQERAVVDAEAAKRRSNCDFCEPLKYTPEDTFGRVEKEFRDTDGTVRRIVTSSNIAKYDAWSGVVSFNVAMATPCMTAGGDVPLCVTRIVDRGPISKPTVDMAGMELYGTPVVATDPYAVADSLGTRLNPKHE